MPTHSYLIRLRAGLRGAGKDVKVKLSQMLVSKGVPYEAVDARIREILAVLTEEQLQQAQDAFDPWIALKNLAGQKVRLITQEELKTRKKTQRQASRASDAEVRDPWDKEDPWSAARKSQDRSQDIPGPLEIQLLPEFFSNEDGASPDILPTIHREACGICMLSVEEIHKFATMPAQISVHECAAVVVGDDSLQAGKFPAVQVNFVAKHAAAGKVLLKGTLINFGVNQISARKPPREYALNIQDLKVIAFEIHASHCTSWQAIKQNPIRHIWKSLDKVQSKVLTTWSRRYFNGKKQCGMVDATSFHCFARIVADDMRSVLVQSGLEGIFVTLKGDQGLPDGCYRVVWLESDSLEQALAMTQTHANIMGVVKGRGNLGLRVAVQSYTSVRQSIEPTWSNDKKIRYNVKVLMKFVMAPVPVATDKGALQAVLDEFCWLAVPLRQMGANSWLIGAEKEPPHETITIAGELALISVYQPSKNLKMPSSAVLAAPASIKRELDKQIQAGAYSCGVPEKEVKPAPAPMLPPPIG